MKKKMILVTGATGAQGGSVTRALLEDNHFSVRILTRNSSSPKALELKNAGAEVVQGDLDDTASLLRAMRGCYGVFGVTNFWEHFGKEFQQGKNLVDAVKLSGIEHFVFHTLRDYNKLGEGKYPVPHCDIKAELQRYCVSLEIPASFVHVAFYYENFFSFFPPQKAADGSFFFGFPQGDTKLAMASVEDIGGIVKSIFNHPAEYIGRTVGVVGSDNTCAEYANAMSRVLNQNIQYKYIPRAVYAELGFPGAEELANMFEVQRLHIPDRQIDLIESYGLNTDMQSFENWLRKKKDVFEAQLAAVRPFEEMVA
ncbi:MAG TPA: NmrA/HSCARG family protein [Puia sp.]|jgi:uncharacterized protein YbjT (DUF2867 family)